MRLKNWMLLVAAIFVLSFVDGVMTVPYAIKLLFKWSLFGLFLYNRRNAVSWWWKRPLPTRGALVRSIVAALGFAVLLAVVVLPLLGGIDREMLRHTIFERYRLQGYAFVLGSLYLVIGNALLEELVFRVAIEDGRMASRLFSALLFALYHLTNFSAYVTLGLGSLVFLVLFTGGLFFSWLLVRYRHLLYPYLFHAAIDLAIVVIGAVLLFA